MIKPRTEVFGGLNTRGEAGWEEERTEEEGGIEECTMSGQPVRIQMT